jgi:hypothetical protein
VNRASTLGANSIGFMLLINEIPCHLLRHSSGEATLSFVSSGHRIGHFNPELLLVVLVGFSPYQWHGAESAYLDAAVFSPSGCDSFVCWHLRRLSSGYLYSSPAPFASISFILIVGGLKSAHLLLHIESEDKIADTNRLIFVFLPGVYAIALTQDAAHATIPRSCMACLYRN